MALKKFTIQYADRLLQMSGKSMKAISRRKKKKKLELQKKTCEFCGRKFDHPSAFYRHRKTHMGIKNHICSECGQAFTEKRYMDDHYNVKHLGLKNYPCEHCGKLFGSHNSLANHKKSIHGTGPSAQSSNVSKIIS